MAKPQKFPSGTIFKYLIITKILKECDLQSQDRLLSAVVSDPHSEVERNQTSGRKISTAGVNCLSLASLYILENC